jgi:hypothetical protein
MEWYSRSSVLVTYTDLITAKQQHEANLKFIDYLEVASLPLHVIADWRGADNYPIDFDIVPDMLTMLRHKNMGWIVVIGMNNILSCWAEFFTKMAGLRYTHCETVEEAAQFLLGRENDKTA